VTRLNCQINQTVAGEATPSLEIDADTRLRADEGDEIARTSTPQRSNQLWQ
jgi:hypothetical protein